MSVTPESVVAIIFFVLPGYIGVRVFEWHVAGSARSAFEEVLWALTLSIVAAAPLLLLADGRLVLDHLWQPESLNRFAIGGVFIHTLATTLVALVVGYVVRRADASRWMNLSIFDHSWDGLWSPVASQQRWIFVQTDGGMYAGELELADRGQIGRDLVLRKPAKWDEKTNSYAPTGAEFMYIAGKSISTLQVSIPYQEKADD
jgi:hypothetical protein